MTEMITRIPKPTLLRHMAQILTEEELAAGIEFPDIEDGRPLATQANIMTFLSRVGVVLMYDEFALRTHVVGLPGHAFLSDAAFNDIYVGMDLVGLRVPKEHLWAVLTSYARNLSEHAVCAKLDEVERSWDGKPRIDSWLIDYCGAPDNAYTRAIGAKWMIAAARRVRSPGVKFDHILILEGDQGTGKSTVFRTLAYDEWFTDNLTIGMESKEVIELTQGKWICELAELTNIGKRDVEATKHFVTKQKDEARLSYARTSTEVHRQFVLAATTNKSRYLRDDTGDRRFWMVGTTGVIDTGQRGLPLMLDVSGLRAERDQLWGEAARRESQGESIFLAPDVEALARAEQASRFDVDDRQQYLEDLVADKSGFVPAEELYKALGIDLVKDRHSAISKLVASCMIRAGWQPNRARVGSGDHRAQVRGYLSPGGRRDKVLRFVVGHGLQEMLEGV